MNCPTLDELPLPSSGRTGWPWNKDSQPLRDDTCNTSLWPRVSVVTPSYNQAQFLEETIRSVLLQQHPNLEYIVVDGGSTDESLDIIRKYEPWLAYWVSEADQGQSDAINKGWKRSTGEIVAWLNSDDYYEPGAVLNACEFLQAHQDVDMIYGCCYLVDAGSREIAPFWHHFFDVRQMIQDHRLCIPQQTVFIRKRILDKVGLLDENLHFKMDRDLYIRIGLSGKVAKVEGHLANLRVHGGAKSTYRNALGAWREFQLIRIRHGGHPSLSSDARYWKEFVRESVKNTVPGIPIANIAIPHIRRILRLSR